MGRGQRLKLAQYLPLDALRAVQTLRWLSVAAILSDLLLLSCLAAFYTGIVLAIASLLN
jgi:hypothetical protein